MVVEKGEKKVERSSQTAPAIPPAWHGGDEMPDSPSMNIAQPVQPVPNPVPATRLHRNQSQPVNVPVPVHPKYHTTLRVWNAMVGIGCENMEEKNQNVVVCRGKGCFTESFCPVLSVLFCCCYGFVAKSVSFWVLCLYSMQKGKSMRKACGRRKACVKCVKFFIAMHVVMSLLTT